ncbi:MAG: hypothetical protein HFJ06_01175 [Lachnospiraceae bacterium]|nr:hypothetical protein [Lachnospiraceae bacterium]
MKKAFLATTAMENCWDLNAEKMLLAEERCYSHKFDINCDAIPIECVDREVFSHANLNQYNIEIESVHTHILNKIMNLLNDYHRVSFEFRTWDMMFYYWLDYYIEGIYIKYKRLEAAREKYDVYVYGLSKDDYRYPNFGSGYLVWANRDDLYAFQLYTEISQNMGIHIEKYLSFPENKERMKTKRGGFVAEKKVNHCINLFSKGAETIVINPDTYHFTFWDKAFVSFRSRGKTRFVYLKNVQPKHWEYDILLRKKLADQIQEKCDSEIERILCNMIFYDMPLCYLEGFNDVISYGKKYAGMKTKHIVTAEDWHYSEGIKSYIALLRENGAQVCTLKTGGDANIHEGRSETSADVRISDVVYTSGWEMETEKCKLERLTSPRVVDYDRKKCRNEKDADILYAGSVVMGYGLIIGNVTSFLAEVYVRKTVWLLKKISQNDHLTIRVRMNRVMGENGWYIEKRINENTKDNVLIDNWEEGFHSAVKKSRLVIYDAFDSIWIEVFHLKVPFLVVGMKELEYYTKDGMDLIEVLTRTGIYHNDYEEASAYIENVVKDIEGWWEQPERKEALEYISHHFGHCAKVPKREWKQKFININKSR